MSVIDEGELTLATPAQKDALRYILENDHISFCKYFLRVKNEETFNVGPHHQIIADTLERVFNLEINRLVINIPPGYTKTLQAVVMWIARCLARVPNARFIHTSFSDTLVNDNSDEIQEIIKLPEFQALWQRKIRTDKSNKSLWRTTSHGGMLAKPSGGPITGFRAGRMFDSFTGALVIDDPLKPDDASSAKEREKINKRFNNTMRSRLAVEDVPIIVIMQRLHKEDLSGFLLRGGSGEYWHHLMLPIEIDNSIPYPQEFTHGIPINYDLPNGPLWDKKHTQKQIDILKADPEVYNSQYLQRPVTSMGAIFDLTKCPRYRELPNLKFRMIYGDTAQKTKELNDYSVLQCWGMGVDGRIYLIDQMRGKWKAPELRKNAYTFWLKHKAFNENVESGFLRAMKIEDKSSGTMLIQDMSGKIPIVGIPRDKDKVTRAHDVSPSVNAGLVCLPHEHDAPWMKEYVDEVAGFPDMPHDDQVDPTMDAIYDMLGSGVKALEALAS